MFVIRCNLDTQWMVRRFEVTGPSGYLLTANADAHSAQHVIDHISRACSHRCDNKRILCAVNEALRNNVATFNI